jgi:Mn-dependent DtxR family transcriptional regulator
MHGGGCRYLSFRSRSKRVLYDQEFSEHRVVKRERYRGFTLTEGGRAMAREIHARRRILTAFLQSLGLPESVVLHDVHGLEHHLSKRTLERLKRFVQETRADQKLSRLVVQVG